jgi:hypothetical protein
MLANASIQAAMTLQGLLLWAVFKRLAGHVGASSFSKLDPRFRWDDTRLHRWSR